jgi:hypothetical protein
MGKSLQITITIKDENGETISTNENSVPYIGEDPDADVAAMLAEKSELQPTLGVLSNRELEKFILRAKSEGLEMPFGDMEMGVLAAGRKDMQNGLAEILNSLKFDKPDCPECDDGMDNLGRIKKNS